MADTTIPDATLAAFLDALHRANTTVTHHYPGELPVRQPVHCVYGGANLFRSDSVRKLGSIALGVLREYAPDADALAAAIGLSPDVARRVYTRIVDKLAREPIEDYRLDFEDGFGYRPDDEEDGFAKSAADELAAGLAAGTLPPMIGIRIKPLSEELKGRSIRTLDLFLTRLLDKTGGKLPPAFVVTLPKITSPEQVSALTSACEALEYWHNLEAGSLRIEIMIETTQSIFGLDGALAIPRLLTEGRGRIVAVHFGPYDYTAACNITAAHQHATHPTALFAKLIMQVAVAGTGIWLADGPTNLLPIAPHRPPKDGELTPAERDENRRAIHHAWRLHAEQIHTALVNGFYQGWDLHPAQLPIRYAAVYAFFFEGIDAASERLKNFVDKAAQATLVRQVFDDAATGQGLLNYFLRAMNCGAITEQEALDMSGLSADELRSRSFLKILANRAHV